MNARAAGQIRAGIALARSRQRLVFHSRVPLTLGVAIGSDGWWTTGGSGTALPRLTVTAYQRAAGPPVPPRTGTGIR